MSSPAALLLLLMLFFLLFTLLLLLSGGLLCTGLKAGGTTAETSRKMRNFNSFFFSSCSGLEKGNLPPPRLFRGTQKSLHIISTALCYFLSHRAPSLKSCFNHSVLMKIVILPHRNSNWEGASLKNFHPIPPPPPKITAYVRPVV